MIALKPEEVKIIVLAACCLHNMLIDEQPAYVSTMMDQENKDHQVVGGHWRADPRLENMEKTQARNCSLNAKRQRQFLKIYFNSEFGSVPWQERMVAVKK